MIYLYPANKMESLLALLSQIQRISPLPVFSKEVIVVQNAGMQHWLNMSLADERGISLNIDYALPSQYLWKLLRSLTPSENIPEQSPFARETLTWRIYALLGSDIVLNDNDFQIVSAYWQQELSANNASLKRYKLAEQLADLYEQYLIFRPEWIDDWSAGRFNQLSNDNQSNENVQHLSLWQGKLWQLLTAQQKYNPLALIKSIIKQLPQQYKALPKRISFFGLNAMPPLWLSLLDAISEYTEVHFFHLNPCFAYWGDIVSEKQAVNYLNQWLDGYDDPQSFVGNPLLANLGQQGREFVALLQNISTVNIEAFDELPSPNEHMSQSQLQFSVLSQVQHDILSLHDARQSKHVKGSTAQFNNEQEINRQHDDSIVLTSCHNALREVQGLHDWLLHQFNNDKSLTPKDVLVMCPQIEHYAPYVNAVFTRGWQELNNDVPPLPCSIADRSANNSDPLVVAFLSLLSLPDSRFHVSTLVSFLRVPAIADKFDIPAESLEIIIIWLEKASIHWGLDAKHKSTLLKLDESQCQANNNFTWQQGLSRLLIGFAFADQDTIFQNQLLLSTVEGANALLLGKLMLLIEQLHSLSLQLLTKRTAKQWQQFLLSNIEDVFAENKENDASLTVITHAVSSLVNYCYQAQFTETIELAIVQDFLQQHFSQPDPGRQFMIGQVTFCSMLPMRSIPFKIIAVLGLNEGEFPRQRQALGFDLMAVTPSKLGDRSRRGDDRYLFLEALISARQALYLSFQGRNIKNNKEKQPSIVLKELMAYLADGYGWCFQKTQNSDLRQLPMQAFSVNNYLGKWSSFDSNWLKLALQQNPALPVQTESTNTQSFIINDSSDEEYSEAQDNNQAVCELNVSQLINFYQHPAKAFANQQLNLFFQQNKAEQEDEEPFSSNGLQSYLLRQDLLNAFLEGSSVENDNNSATEQAVNQVLLAAELSGNFPDLPKSSEQFKRWQHDSEHFSQAIVEQSLDNPVLINCQVQLSINISRDNTSKVMKTVVLSAQMPIKNNQCVFYRSSSAKPKDIFTLYLHHLIVQLWQQQYAKNKANSLSEEQIQSAQSLQQVTSTTGIYFNTKSQKVEQLQFTELESDLEHGTSIVTQIENLIKFYFQGHQQVLLLNTELADKMYNSKGVKQGELSQSAFDLFWTGGNSNGNKVTTNGVPAFGEDDYIHFFWSDIPAFSSHYSILNLIYAPVYQALSPVNTSKVSEIAQNNGVKK